MTSRLSLLLGATLATLTISSTLMTSNAAAGGHFGGGGHGGGGGHFGGGGGGGHFGGGVHVGGGGGGHVGGGVHVGGGIHWGGGYGGYRPNSWGVSGHVVVGGGYYRPYRPYYNYYYPVPAYYGASYYPVETTEVYGGPSIAPILQPALPKFGIGLFGGGVATDHNIQTNTQESDLGLLARYRLTDGLILEGELGKTATSVNGVDNLRVDRRLGGSLLYEFGAENHFAPYILGGLGVQQANVDGNYSTTQDYGEVGAGVRYAFNRNFHVTFDLRAGSRTSVSGDSNMAALSSTARTIAPPSSTDSNKGEDYTRARLAAILYF